MSKEALWNALRILKPRRYQKWKKRPFFDLGSTYHAKKAPLHSSISFGTQKTPSFLRCWSVWTNQTLSRSVFIKVLLSLSLFYQTRSYPLYQYQLWSSLTSEPPHQSQRIFTLCCKCCFNKANQTLRVCKDWQWCKATSTFLQAFLFSKWTVFCRMITSLHGTTRQTFCG